MTGDGRRTISAILLIVGAALFVPAFADAASGFDGGSWTYAPYLQIILDQFSIIVALFALAGLALMLNKHAT